MRPPRCRRRPAGAGRRRRGRPGHRRREGQGGGVRRRLVPAGLGAGFDECLHGRRKSPPRCCSARNCSARCRARSSTSSATWRAPGPTRPISIRRPGHALDAANAAQAEGGRGEDRRGRGPGTGAGVAAQRSGPAGRAGGAARTAAGRLRRRPGDGGRPAEPARPVQPVAGGEGSRGGSGPARRHRGSSDRRRGGRPAGRRCGRPGRRRSGRRGRPLLQRSGRCRRRPRAMPRPLRPLQAEADAERAAAEQEAANQAARQAQEAQAAQDNEPYYASCDDGAGGRPRTDRRVASPGTALCWIRTTTASPARALLLRQRRRPLPRRATETYYASCDEARACRPWSDQPW